MRKPRSLFLIILLSLLLGARPAPSIAVQENNPIPDTIEVQSDVDLPEQSNERATALAQPETNSLTQTAQPTPTPTPEPDPFTSFYGCDMEIQILSGPLESDTSAFHVLDESYFDDKGDKFNIGKGTGVFYAQQPYLILHSSYINANILRPMEAEFLRKYLENWGNHGTEFIQTQIDSLVGSEVLWICDGNAVFKTRINGITRLSHEASNRLWLKPEELEDLLIAREGLVSEWVGEIPVSDETVLYLGFCGWGPKSLDSGRYTYFRYLIQFEVIS